jgi:hypothetical protein
MYLRVLCVCVCVSILFPPVVPASGASSSSSSTSQPGALYSPVSAPAPMTPTRVHLWLQQCQHPGDHSPAARIQPVRQQQLRLLLHWPGAVPQAPAHQLHPPLDAAKEGAGPRGDEGGGGGVREGGPKGRGLERPLIAGDLLFLLP